MIIKPITPSEVSILQQQSLPDFVVESFNSLIAKRWDGHNAIIKQDEAIDEIMRRWLPAGEGARSVIYSNGWLEVEEFYRNAGWTVEYDKPAYIETYPASFKFTIARKS